MNRHEKMQSTFTSRSWKFWVIFGYILIVAIFCIAGSWTLFGPLDDAIIDEQTDSLVAVAQAGIVSLEDTTRTPEDITTDLVAETDLRATIIASDGTVLGDSAGDASTRENHLDRPEVQAALSGQTGSDIRTSATTGDEELYVALPATYENETVVLRISAQVSNITTISEGVRNTGLTLLLGGVFIALLIAWRTYISASHPVSRLERVRSDFVANASHELKTPVAGIRLLSDAISSASEDGDLKQTKIFAQRLDTEADRLQHLVTDLLDLSRLESKETKNALVKSDLHSAVVTSFEAHRLKARHKGLELLLEDNTKPSDSCYAFIEASDASLIIDNLLDNALCYTEKGSVTVRLGVHGGIIQLEVEDTGVGIPAAEQSRIFERFYRVDAARSRQAGGTGLGLSLVRHAVKRGGGSVTVDSTVGMGTIFTVKIPQAS